MYLNANLFPSFWTYLSIGFIFDGITVKICKRQSLFQILQTTTCSSHCNNNINNNNLFLIRHKLTSAWIWSIHRLNYQLLFRKWACAPLPNRWLDAWVCYCWLPPIRSLHAFSNLAGSIKFIFPWQADLKRQMQRCCFMGCAIMSYFKLRNLI